MTPARQDLLTALSLVQNHPACINQDIMTFTGFMDDNEVHAHLERYIGYIAEYNFEAAQKPSRRRPRKAA